MVGEIGSEFWGVELTDKRSSLINRRGEFVLSGRTALDMIIQDIKATRELKSIYLPSYCCESMIVPFIEQGIKVTFYDVLINKTGRFEFNVDLTNDIDAILLLQYFGIKNTEVMEIAKTCKEKNMIIIEDITHSFFMNEPCTGYEDYRFGSLRKWTGLYTGAFLDKVSDKFLIPMPRETNDIYYSLRKEGMVLKHTYLESKIGEKKAYLEMLSEAEQRLETDYKGYSIDIESLEKLHMLDIEQLKEKRRRNSNIILKAILNLNFITPVYNEIKDGDVPLFIPVIVKDGLRDKLRKYLIKNRIYCPVHWPISELHSISEQTKEIYDNVLSLVCDQRYDEKEMVYFLEVIRKFER